jgi:hypothetical protein
MTVMEIEGYICPLEIWELPKISPTQQRFFRYHPTSWKHPARMDLVLCRKIIKTYTTKDELILDPMAGIGSTLIEGGLFGRNVIGVELERKFARTAQWNINMLGRLRTLAPKGKVEIIQGDSTKLSKLLSRKADSLVFSPPYFSTTEERGEKRTGKKDMCIRMMKGERGPNDTYGMGNFVPFSKDPRNIHKLREYGEVEAIVFSPPYGTEQFASKDKDRSEYFKHVKGKPSRYVRSETYAEPDNIANAGYGSVDAVVCSPPYADSKKGVPNPEDWATRLEKFGSTKGDYHTPGRLRAAKAMCGGYSQNKRNIANLPHGKIDVVLSSPPYSNSKLVGDSKKIVEMEQYIGRRFGPSFYSSCSDNPRDVGNLPHGEIDAISKHDKGKETYLSAMLKIYENCFNVLKPNGKMVLVVKNFIRNKKIVRLDLDTRRLCEAAGFRFVEAKLFKLPNKSFWRRLYAQKHPEVDTSLVEYEFVLVFVKPASGCRKGGS